jgi:hypothetical protein
MLAHKDQRANERVPSNAPIVFSFFRTRFWHEYPSMTRNHSRDGMCFESSRPLAPPVPTCSSVWTIVKCQIHTSNPQWACAVQPLLR